MDGASKIEQLFNITVPIITPVILFNAIILLIKAFQEFNSAYLITKVRTNKTDLFCLNLYIYDQAFQNGNYGYASALWILVGDHRYIYGYYFQVI